MEFTTRFPAPSSFQLPESRVASAPPPPPGAMYLLVNGSRVGALKVDSQRSLSTMIESIGRASGIAQGLPHAVTDMNKLRVTDHRLYLVAELATSHAARTPTRILGLLKVGTKHLFMRSPHGILDELNPLCVLDFYVHESCQRRGIGRLLLDTMMTVEGIASPSLLAYDRPSSKLIAFLSKHYNLTNYSRQDNHFVMFHDFWEYLEGKVSAAIASVSAAAASPALAPASSAPARAPVAAINTENQPRRRSSLGGLFNDAPPGETTPSRGTPVRRASLPFPEAAGSITPPSSTQKEAIVSNRRGSRFNRSSVGGLFGADPTPDYTPTRSANGRRSSLSTPFAAATTVADSPAKAVNFTPPRSNSRGSSRRSLIPPFQTDPSLEDTTLDLRPTRPKPATPSPDPTPPPPGEARSRGIASRRVSSASPFASAQRAQPPVRHRNAMSPTSPFNDHHEVKQSKGADGELSGDLASALEGALQDSSISTPVKAAPTGPSQADLDAEALLASTIPSLPAGRRRPWATTAPAAAAASNATVQRRSSLSPLPAATALGSLFFRPNPDKIGGYTPSATASNAHRRPGGF